MAKKLKQSDREMLARIKKTRELFVYFGVTPYGYDPGLVGMKTNGGRIDLGASELSWIEPLLVELKQWRESNGEVAPTFGCTY